MVFEFKGILRTGTLRRMLDKNPGPMVKYRQLDIALIGKSTVFETSESRGRWLKVRAGEDSGKCVRERIIY